MIEFHLSKTLAADMAMHLQPARPGSAYALQFYAHRVMVARRKCVIVMELQSRYAMVFCGLTRKEFDYFPDLFQERLWREVLSICELDNEDDMAFMSDLVLNLASEQRYQPGSNRSVQAHINQVAEQLAWMVDNGIYALPVYASDAFVFGLDVNEVPRAVRGSKAYFQPYLVFRDFWMDLMQYARRNAAGVAPAPAAAMPETFAATLAGRKDRPEVNASNKDAGGNVIRVDFTRRRKLD